MKKHTAKQTVGILTFHASHNCGSMLQSFALQKILQKLGYKPLIIDYSNAGQQELYALRYKNSSIKNILKNIILFPHRSLIKRTANNYEKFKYSNLCLTSKAYTVLDELKEEELGFDIYICGSDQIWNITIQDSDDAYFLPFVHKHKKIAYAPSFGAKNLIQYAGDRLGWYKGAVKEFRSLSARENNGKKWIKQITNIDVPVVLDPTLLLEKEDYSRIERRIKVPEHFIFYYAPGYLKDLNDFVRRIARRYNMPVIVFNAKQFYVKRLWKYDFVLSKEEDPGVYLYLMKMADMVFTTSFHGTIFASMYQKKFWTLKNTGMFGDDDRVGTLVSELGVKDRLIIPAEMEQDFDYMQEFNHADYRQKLAKKRAESMKYLKDAMRR